jgi:hypothetical protein
VDQTRCGALGLTNDASLIGISQASCDFSPFTSFYRSIPLQQIKILIIPTQRLFGPRCGTVPRELQAKVLADLIRAVRRLSPFTLVVIQFSLRVSTPQDIVVEARRYANIVDGYYIAYPIGSTIPCLYCSAANLAGVLEAIRSL